MTRAEMIAVCKPIFEALGPAMVAQAVRTGTPMHGWNSCFIAAAVGGTGELQDFFHQMWDKDKAAFRELSAAPEMTANLVGVEPEQIRDFIYLYDSKHDVSSGKAAVDALAREWLSCQSRKHEVAVATAG